MKTVTFYTVVLSVILGFGACATAKMDKELAKLIRRLFGNEKASEIAESIVYKE